jgi:glyoxylase-like metal-dependent hydrolase (beta-lactamase superfamily II)
MRKMESGQRFARFAFGDVTIVSLRDGYIDMPTSRLRQDGDRTFGAGLPQQVELVDGKLRLSVNAFLVIDADRHILIDTGTANTWEPSLGFLLEALRDAGVPREKIETVALTHTHEDHAHGLVAADGTDAFPNLNRLFVPKEEIAMFDAIERLARFRQRREPIEGGFQLSDKITAVEAPGHEVGHTAYEVSSAGETLLIWGDIVHVQSIQFDRPDLTWAYDANQAQARTTRRSVLGWVARRNYYVAGAHLASPGIGTVTQQGEGYRYTPL